MAKWVDLSQKNKTKRNELEKFPQVIKQLLANRGIREAQEAERFFTPTLDKLYSHSVLKESEKAAEAILEAIDKGRKVFIHGDFDVDGVCATSILWDFLYNYLEAEILPYIPDRFEEGYGMSEKTLKAIKEEGGDLVITVDCGIKDLDLIKKWKKKGLEFIITDHHTLFKDKNDKDKVSTLAIANVHPAHPKGEYPFRDLSGTAVAWKLVGVIAQKVRQDKKLSKKFSKLNDINENDYLDLVAIATICDIMPLVDENRILVSNGLEQIKKTARVGLVKLIIKSNLDIENIDAYHVGFVIGPRLNAAGRLGHAMDAVRLLTTKSMSKAQELAKKLSDLNSQRQRLTKEMVEKAREQVIKVQKEEKLYFVWGEDWHKGVVGLVAGKLCEEFNRPVIAGTKVKNEITASARSISSFNIIQAIAEHSKVLERYGGHAQAAGLTIKEKHIEVFKTSIQSTAQKNIKEKDLELEIEFDTEISLSDIDWDLLEWLEKFRPFGFGNRTPRFIIRGVEIAAVDYVGKSQDHIRLAFINKTTGEYVSAIGFSLAKHFPNLSIGDTIDALFSLEVNEWNGNRSIQMKLRDLKVRD